MRRERCNRRRPRRPLIFCCECLTWISSRKSLELVAVLIGQRPLEPTHKLERRPQIPEANCSRYSKPLPRRRPRQAYRLELFAVLSALLHHRRSACRASASTPINCNGLKGLVTPSDAFGSSLASLACLAILLERSPEVTRTSRRSSGDQST
jgi:hypothetical protein